MRGDGGRGFAVRVRRAIEPMWYESEVRILGRGGFTSSDGGRERGRPKEEGTMKRISQKEVCVKTPLRNLLFCILIQQMYFKGKIF